jgi:hypothetical protein
MRNYKITTYIVMVLWSMFTLLIVVGPWFSYEDFGILAFLLTLAGFWSFKYLVEWFEPRQLMIKEYNRKFGETENRIRKMEKEKRKFSEHLMPEFEHPEMEPFEEIVREMITIYENTIDYIQEHIEEGRKRSAPLIALDSHTLALWIVDIALNEQSLDTSKLLGKLNYYFLKSKGIDPLAHKTALNDVVGFKMNLYETGYRLMIKGETSIDMLMGAISYLMVSQDSTPYKYIELEQKSMLEMGATQVFEFTILFTESLKSMRSLAECYKVEFEDEYGK